MSSPPNPLDHFRSYSYHHILMVCDGTDTAEALTDVEDVTIFDHSSPDSKYNVRQTGGGGGYVVLIDGTADAQLTIKSAKWSSIITPTEKPGSENQNSSMGVDGELVIVEPLGVNFLNTLNNVTKSLGVDASGLVFLLKTIFTGHRDDGRTDTITNVRPLMFFAVDIGAVFDITGAEYVLQFVGIVNGVARLPHVSSIADGFSFSIGDVGTTNLKTTIETALTKSINDYYAELRKRLEEDAKSSGSNVDYSNEFQDVTYEFKLDETYDGNYTLDTPPVSAKSSGGDDTIFSIPGNSLNLETLLDLIMQSSSKVLKDESIDEETGVARFMHKITSTIETGPGKYKVIYTIHRYKSAIIPAKQFLEWKPDDSDGIIFDYIFTGKNVDILSFDIKMQLGMAFFQTLSADSSIPNSQKFIPGGGSGENSNQLVNKGNLQGTGDQTVSLKKPLFLGMTLKDSIIRNNRIPTSTSDYNALIARHAAYEGLDARMVIRGNTQLLADTTQTPSDVKSTTNVSASAPVLPDSERNCFSAIHKQPAYVKVNVYMPTGLKKNEGDFATNFWYPGWYMLYQVNHVFDNGEFTQELEMFSLPTDSSDGSLAKPLSGQETPIPVRAKQLPSNTLVEENKEDITVKKQIATINQGKTPQ